MMVSKLRELWLWIFGSALFGILFTAAMVPYGLHQYEQQAAEFDVLNPVVEPLESQITKMDGEAVEVRVVAKRLRGECEFERATGAREDSFGRLESTYILRLGPSPTGTSFPEGSVIISAWRLWPVASDRAVHVIGLYRCNGRPVSQTVARLPLP